MLKRVQLMLDDDLDRGLAREARRLGMSKSELVRRYLRDRLRPLPPLHEDPLWELVGAAGDAEPGDVDEVVYGARRPS